MSEDIFKRVQKVTMAQLDKPEDAVTMEARFEQDLSADSLDIVELVMQLEEEFGIEIPDEDANGIKSVGEAVNYIAAATSK